MSADRVPLADGWTIGVKPNAYGDYWIYAPDGAASTYISAQWLIEHGQPIPERPLAVGDRVQYDDLVDAENQGVVTAPADAYGWLGVTSGTGRNCVWHVNNVTRVVEP